MDTQFDNRFIDSFVRVTNQLAIGPKVLFAKYQIEVLFLDDQNIDVDHLILSKIYYKNLLPVFLFSKMKTTNVLWLGIKNIFWLY